MTYKGVRLCFARRTARRTARRAQVAKTAPLMKGAEGQLEALDKALLKALATTKKPTNISKKAVHALCMTMNVKPAFDTQYILSCKGV